VSTAIYGFHVVADLAEAVDRIMAAELSIPEKIAYV